MNSKHAKNWRYFCAHMVDFRRPGHIYVMEFVIMCGNLISPDCSIRVFVSNYF